MSVPHGTRLLRLSRSRYEFVVMAYHVAGSAAAALLALVGGTIVVLNHPRNIAIALGPCAWCIALGGVSAIGSYRVLWLSWPIALTPSGEVLTHRKWGGTARHAPGSISGFLDVRYSALGEHMVLALDEERRVIVAFSVSSGRRLRQRQLAELGAFIPAPLVKVRLTRNQLHKLSRHRAPRLREGQAVIAFPQPN